MSFPTTLLRTLVLLSLLAMPALAQEEGIHWQTDIESAKALARQTNRLVLIHFWTPSCGPCMMLNQNVFNQAGVGSTLETRFVPVKLNADENSATAMGFGITRVPTDVIITPDGQLVGKLISPPTPAAYIAEVTRLANEYATRSGQAFANAAAVAPTQPHVPQSMNTAYANLPIGPMTPPVIPTVSTPSAGDYYGSVPFPGGATPSATAGPTIGASVPPQSVAMSPAGIGAPTSQPPTAQAAVPPVPSMPQVQTNRYASYTPAASPAGGAAPFAAPPQATSPGVAATAAPITPAAAAPSVVANQYAAVQPANAPAISAASAATAPATSASSGAPDIRRLPPGAPPLGFDGYCPVSMRNQWKWVAGDPQWGIVHRGRTYWFASQQEQQQFWSNPDHFSPALSGMDPVLAIDHKQQVPGRREHSLDYDNLFYLFASEATLQQFAANPERYAANVRQAMGIERGRMVR